MVDQNNIQTRLKDGYEALLFEYAAGNLDDAHRLIVATHLSLSQTGRERVQSCEAIGGAMLENECQPVTMAINSLENVLNRLDTEPARHTPKPGSRQYPDGLSAPAPLQNVLSNQKRNLRWKGMMPGISTFTVDTPTQKAAVRFYNFGPAQKTPHHSHAGTEITLILEGAFTDETGRYGVGDLIVADEDTHHSPTACPEQGCVCMVVSTAPIRLKGIASLLNPFLRR